MKPLFGNIDLGAYFGAEVRVLDGEEGLFIPLRFNPSIRRAGSRIIANYLLRPMSYPDPDGFLYTAFPHIPKSYHLAPADREKMTPKIGRFLVIGVPDQTSPAEEPPARPGVGHDILAANPVNPDSIPL